MRKFQLFCGPSKEQALGVGGIVLLDGTSLAIPSVPLDSYNRQTKRYFVNFEHLSGKLTEIVEFDEWTDKL